MSENKDLTSESHTLMPETHNLISESRGLISQTLTLTFGVYHLRPRNIHLVKSENNLTPAAPDPAALRGRLGEGRAKIALPAGLRVKIRRVR